MNSMENFFNWIAKPLPNDEVVIWFNVHNMIYEKIELYGDIFKSLNYVITDTYMGDSNGDSPETKIVLSPEDKQSHFDWCWSKMVENFHKENIIIISDMDEGKVIDIPFDLFQRLFYPAYAITIYKSQGSTFDNEYTVHEWDHGLFNDRLKYVALSRATNLKNIYIYR